MDIKKLRSSVIQSKLDTAVKCDYLDYISANENHAEQSLRTLIFDFLGVEKAIHASEKCDNIKDWVSSVVAYLSPSVKNYTWEQVDLLVAILTYEQTLRDESYCNILGRFTELYEIEGGVFDGRDIRKNGYV